jgi:hypothetical protein
MSRAVRGNDGWRWDRKLLGPGRSLFYVYVSPVTGRQRRSLFRFYSTISNENES